MANQNQQPNTKKPSNVNTEKALMGLQQAYFATGDKKYLSDMIGELLPYARSQVLKKLRGRVFLAPDIVDNYALDACVKFMTQYDSPNFKVDTSFGGLLGLKVLESMHGPKVIRADKIGSLNEHIEGIKGEGSEIGELSESLNFQYLFQNQNENRTFDPADYLFKDESAVIDSILTVVRDNADVLSPKEQLKINIGVWQFVKKSKTYDRFVEFYLDDKLRAILELTILEMRNRLVEVA